MIEHIMILISCFHCICVAAVQRRIRIRRWTTFSSNTSNRIFCLAYSYHDRHLEVLDPSRSSQLVLTHFQQSNWRFWEHEVVLIEVVWWMLNSTVPATWGIPDFWRRGINRWLCAIPWGLSNGVNGNYRLASPFQGSWLLIGSPCLACISLAWL